MGGLSAPSVLKIQSELPRMNSKRYLKLVHEDKSAIGKMLTAAISSSEKHIEVQERISGEFSRSNCSTAKLLRQPSEDLLPAPKNPMRAAVPSTQDLEDKEIILERDEEDSSGSESAPSRLSHTDTKKSEAEEVESLSAHQIYDLFYLKRQLDAYKMFEEMKVQRQHQSIIDSLFLQE